MTTEPITTPTGTDPGITTLVVPPVTTEPTTPAIPAPGTEDKVFSQAELDAVVRKVKLKAEVQKEMGRDDFLKENGFNTLEDFTSFKTNFDTMKTDLDGFKLKAETAETDGVFAKYSITDESVKSKITKLAAIDITDGVTKLQALENTITDFGDMFKISTAIPAVPATPATPAQPKPKVGAEAKPNTINGTSLEDYYNTKYKSYYDRQGK